VDLLIGSDYIGRWGCWANRKQWELYYLRKVWGESEDDEKLDLVGYVSFDYEIRVDNDDEKLRRIMGNLAGRGCI